MKKFWQITLILILTVSVLASCAQTATEEQAPPAEPAAAALTLSGPATQVSWTSAELESLGAVTVETENKEGEIEEHSGVPLLDLLAEAGLGQDLSTLTFVGSDGYEASVDYAEVESCTDCIVARQDNGELGMVLPGFSGKVQVKGVVEIRVE